MFNKVIRINMNDLKINEETLKDSYMKLSGRFLSSRLVYDEIPPLSHPLGSHNKLFITCGLLAGTTVSCANRLSIGSKSPLTGTIKESNAGGIAAFKMGRLGIRAIILEELPDEDNDWYIAVINKDGCRIEEASYLLNKGTNEKAKLLYKKFGDKIGLILIGPAGEKKLVTSGIAINDTKGVPSRYSGRGGLGAVMGSKHLLAIVLDDTECTLQDVADKNMFKAKVKKISKNILETPQTSESFPKYGTAAMMELTNAIGGLPTSNFKTGRFENADKINGQALYDKITERGGEGKTTHACMPGCMVRCSNIYPDKNGKQIVSPLEYETICLAGSNLEIDDLDVIAKYNYYCNDYGIDTIEVGTAIGVLMESGILPFGDKEGVLNLMKNEVLRSTPLGRIIASGCDTTGKVFGVHKTPTVKGQAMPAYDPRAVKGTAVTYATSTMGADHTAGNLVRANIKPEMKEQFISASRDAQISMNIFDGLGFCIMVGAAIKDLKDITDIINARFGWDMTVGELNNISKSSLTLEKQFNCNAGFTIAHDRLPEFFYEEKNPSTGTVFDINEEFIEKLNYSDD